MATNDLKILAIDDSRDDLTLLSRAVSVNLPGATLLTAPDGQGGIDLALAEDPDVILLDIVLPEIDGFEVCRMLKGDERLAHIPVLFMTAFRTDTESRVKALEVGAEAFLGKPIEHAELIAQIRAMAKIKASHRLQKLHEEQLSALVAERTRELQEELVEHNQSDEEKRRLAGLLDEAPSGIMVMGMDACSLYANQRMYDWHGRSREESPSLDLRNLIVQEELALIPVHMKKVIEQGSATFETTGMRKDGTAFPMEVHAKLVQWGDLQAMLGIETDITERKRAEEETRRLREMVDCAPSAITVHDFDGNYLYSNQRALDLHGYSREEFLDVNVRDLDLPESRALFAPRVQELRERGEAVFEVAHFRKDGSVLPLEIYGRVAKWGDREVVLSIATDITERKKAEVQIRRLAELLEYAPSCIAVADLDGRCLYANQRVYDLHGYSAAESPSLNLGQLIATEKRGAIPAHMQTVMRQGSATFETTGLRKDGSTMPLEIHARTTQWGDRQAILSIATDITERKRAEEERLALERQLLHSQKLESLGVLAGGIAHDFNNLLQVILGNVEMAKTGLAPGASAHLDVEEAIRAINRAADLSRQMLAYAGEGRFVIEDVNLNDLVAENASMFRTAISRTVDLQIHREPGLPPVLADAAQMQQVLMNLLTNASEAIGEAAGNVTLRTGLMVCDAGYLSRSCLEEKPAPGQFIWLEVTDDGCGMDEETQKRLFEPFYTTKFAGRGLGLSAVMGIVRGHHGALMLESDLGRGTTIRVLFPAPQREGASADEVKAADAGVTAASVSGMGTVLVVDDEPSVRAFCAKVVRSQGYDVLTARDGEETVRLFCEHKETIRCTLLDFTMPRMSGLATFEEIRRIKPDAKVILCSGYGEEKATESFKGQGLAGFLQKPYTLDAVTAILGEVLKSKASI